MTSINPERNSQRRWHPLLQEWVVIAAQTQNRPWSGDIPAKSSNNDLTHDPSCYLCPDVKRASGAVNPKYKNIYVFENDFASFTTFDHGSPSKKPNPHAEPHSEQDNLNKTVNLFRTDSTEGKCKVICFSENHSLSLSRMPPVNIKYLVDTWVSEFNLLTSDPKIKNVLIFENKGKVIGVSNEHPHGQIYATGFIPRNIAIQQQSFNTHKEQYCECLLCKLVAEERELNQRIILENEHFIAFVPFFARFAYEVIITSKTHHSAINSLNEETLKSLATIYQQMLIKYDNLFEMDFPNITALINSPLENGEVDPNFHMYLSFTPPLREAEKLKYLAGFESAGGNVINPLQPEVAANTLRELPSIHYSLS